MLTVSRSGKCGWQKKHADKCDDFAALIKKIVDVLAGMLSRSRADLKKDSVGVTWKVGKKVAITK